jgi:peroxiredoxin
MKSIALFAAVALLSFAGTAEAAPIRATLQPVVDRKPAPAFELADASGRHVPLSAYRGHPLLLNLWATKCGGCILEIPSFIEMDQAYRNKGLAVVGISMDILYEDLKGPAEAWALVTPFVSAHKLNYKILMGDDDVTKHYNVEALPITHLIDAHGRIAASYIGLVDKDNIEANIKLLLAER